MEEDKKEKQGQAEAKPLRINDDSISKFEYKKTFLPFIRKHVIARVASTKCLHIAWNTCHDEAQQTMK